jgi:hypothetical protein
MNLNAIDDDSEESDFSSLAGEDVDLNLNHYRVPKLLNYGPFGINSPPKTRSHREQVKFSNEGKIMTLTELAAQKVACHLPFGLVEHFEPPVPEPMQCRIAYWSFPQDEEDVKLYTCLANGSADFFYRAEELINQNAVRDMLQVGFHLSANVQFMSEDENLELFRVAVTFDRRRITSCSCTCMTSTFWCQHVVAVCLRRIRNPQEVKIRAPVSESLQRLEKNQLQKFAQYLINELPQQILPAAQKLLDELLSGDEASINLNPAAPDPTAGATINEQTNWCLDYSRLSLDIHRILLKQCTAQPTVCSDIQSLHATAPPATAEYSQLLRPIRGREPEGIYNLISIVGEMMKRRDPNLFSLLEIMTEEVMKFDKIITWWFETKVSMHSGSSIHFASTKNSQCTSQYSCSNFCDEIVHLWRLAGLNPSASQSERQRLSRKFFDWHLAILKKHSSILENGSLIGPHPQANRRNLLELFPGFKSAIEGCHIEWQDWDDKKSKLINIDEFGAEANCQLVEGKEKPLKQGKRRRRRSKASKHNSGDCTNKCEAEETTPVSGAQEPIPEEVPDEHNDQENVIEQRNDHLAGPQDQQEQDEPIRPAARREPLGQQNEQVNELENDLQVYYMDGLPDVSQKAPESENLADLIKVNLKRLADPLEILYAKVEGLHAHGHSDEARKLARKLAADILNQPNYPSHKQFYSFPKKRKKKGSLDNQMSIVSSETLTKIHFLCNVLLEDPENHALIFNLVMFGVELKRAPAATKPLEVKLISQKQELIVLLKNITLHDAEFDIIRKKAELIRDSQDGPQLDPFTTLILGDFIFDALILSRHVRQPDDDNLGFRCALSALGVRINVIETEHPLLCEGIRRQRGGLALSLITHYKDDQEKLDLILKQLLDKDPINAKSICEKSPSNGKKNVSQQDPNQPTEAAAHFMFELAKTVFDKAGGNSNTAHLFRPQLVAQNGVRSIHRKLHMCTLRIALYALGLHNRISPNWDWRTYNGKAHFIHEQALEIGLPGIKFLCENWQGYLTPVEAAAIAAKAGCSIDAETKRIAAEMAKSCLRYIDHLDYSAVTRILDQCKEQSVEMIEEACSEIEQIAEDGSLGADILFATARAWHCLYTDLITDERPCANGNLYQLTSSEHQDTGADWLANSGQAHIERHQQIVDVAHPQIWNAYATSHEFILAHDQPIYKNFDYVRAAFRVGIKALENIKLSLHVGTSHNPKKLDEILWLFGISKALGRDYMHTFSNAIVQNKSITDPFALHVVIIEINNFFKSIKLCPSHQDRTTIVDPILSKCLDSCWKQTKIELSKLSLFEQKVCIETILEVIKKLTIEINDVYQEIYQPEQKLPKALTPAHYFWEILKYLEHRMEKRSHSHRKIIYVNLAEQRSWVKKFVQSINACACDDCWIVRENELQLQLQRPRFGTLYKPK